jgi:hypothetical protein
MHFYVGKNCITTKRRVLHEDPLVPTSQRLQLADSTVVQPYGIPENVLIKFQDSSTLVNFYGHGYGSSLANLHHPREALPEVIQSNH